MTVNHIEGGKRIVHGFRANHSRAYSQGLRGCSDNRDVSVTSDRVDLGVYDVTTTTWKNGPRTDREEDVVRLAIHHTFYWQGPIEKNWFQEGQGDAYSLRAKIQVDADFCSPAVYYSFTGG